MSVYRLRRARILAGVLLVISFDTAASSPELDRPVVSLLPQGMAEVWGRFENFNPRYDIFGFQKNSGTSSRLTDAYTAAAGVKYALTDWLHASYLFRRSFYEIKRVTEPYAVSNYVSGHDLRLQMRLMDWHAWSLAGEIGYRWHRADPLGFQRYEVGNYALQSLDGSPVLSFKANDKTWLAEGRVRYIWNNNLLFSLDGGYRYAKVSARLISAVLNDRLIGPLLRAQAPQDTPWYEHHWRLGAGVDWRMSPRFSTTWHIGYVRIGRKDYIPRVNKTDYNDNLTLDGAVYWYVKPTFSLFVHGRASTHYVLGDMPLLYNTRTNHIFKNPYGILSAGMAWAF